MPPEPLPGSLALQAAFVVLALVLVFVTGLGVTAGSVAFVTGITAVVLAVAMTRGRVPAGVVKAWNVMGLALLANIVGVAIASTPMFAAFGPDRLNVFITRMPYTLLPTVMVLAAWAGHLVIFRALSLRAASTPDPRSVP